VTDETAPMIDVHHREDQQRYEAVLAGRVVGEADYRPAGNGAWVFHHTFVDPAQRGQGIAERLVAEAMADVRRRGVKVVPTCWYVAQWLDQHPDHADLRAA
jgi:uncharacterized protein